MKNYDKNLISDKIKISNKKLSILFDNAYFTLLECDLNGILIVQCIPLLII